MKKSILYIIGLTALLVLSGLSSVHCVEPGAFDAGEVEPRQELDFDEETYMYRDLLDVTPTNDSYMLWDDWGGTWSDAEKLPYNYEDDLMCWAAAASNVLEWTGWGLVDGMNNTDEIFQHFQDHWTDEGSLPDIAWHWWFDGTEIVPGPGWSHVDVPGGGNFWPTYTFSDYYDEQWVNSQTLAAIDSFLHDGYGTTMAIYTDTGGGHAITCWGFSFDLSDPDYYVGVWVTDSDDDKHLSNPPDSLRYYEVTYDSVRRRWHLQNFYGSDSWYVGGIMALRPRVTSPISIYTDEYSYSVGDTMHLGLGLTNPLDQAITVCVAVWLERPSSPIVEILHAHAVTLPAGFTYSNPDFETFLLPNLTSGTYTWHAALLNPTTHAVLIEDTAEWEFN